MKKSIIGEKSFAFAVRIVRMYRYFSEFKKEYVLSKQLLRAGTSIGANIQEGLQGVSSKDFQYKLSISLKEAEETMYWLRLMKETDYIDDMTFNSMSADCHELIKILTAILKTSRSNNP